MIIIKAISLFLITLIPGLMVFRWSAAKQSNFKSVLIFSGAFLLSITILHILPHLYADKGDDMSISLFILIGVFVQMTLESFTSGVEHGHWHNHGSAHRSAAFPYGLTIALCLHSLMEGFILVSDGHSHSHGFMDSLLLGVAIHKIPAAIALVTVLMSELKNRKLTLFILLVFTLTSPLGMILSEVLQNANLMVERVYEVIMALAAGSFIYISSTILFEARKDHKIHFSNILPALIGATAAVLIEFLVG
jgi:zinc transporter ZupT